MPGASSEHVRNALQMKARTPSEACRRRGTPGLPVSLDFDTSTGMFREGFFELPSAKAVSGNKEC